MPTVREVLQLSAVRRGQPEVVAAAGGLDRPVRWVHAIEFADAARLLRGGELVLTTGIALPDEEALIGAYVAGQLGKDVPRADAYAAAGTVLAAAALTAAALYLERCCRARGPDDRDTDDDDQADWR